MSLVTLSGIHKFFPSTSTLALNGASLELRAGEVHTLVGENGAGKSTLARILCGFEQADSGSMELRGRPVRFLSHRDAERAGIGFVPQHSMLAMGLSAAENVALGREPRRLGLFTDKRRAEYDFSMLSERYGFDVDPRATVSSLAVSARKELEILRALARGGDILVLDEPTSILGETETAALFTLIRRLTSAGAGIVYISHRSKEILNLADRISVMRDGAVERTVQAAELDERTLAGLIVRGGSTPVSTGMPAEPGEPVLVMRGVSLPGTNALSGVDLVVRSGEIVVVVALGGNGLEALEDIASGCVRPAAGDLLVLGRDMASWPRRELRTKLMAYIPTDREQRGLCLRSSVASNVLAGSLFEYSFAGFAAGTGPLRDAAAMLAGFGVRSWERRRAETLSGGNRQRVVAARELGGSPKLVVAANPVQGLDGTSRAAMFARLVELRDKGAAILVLSSDPEDAAELADRSFALYRGRLRPLDGTETHDSAFAAALTGALP